MGSFDARLRVIGQTGFPLVVAIDLSDERMTLSTDETEVANWPIKDIDVSALSDGFHIKAEGEEVLLNVTDSARFAVELGVIDFLSKIK